MVSPSDSNMKVLPLNMISTVDVEPVGRWFLAQWHRIHAAKGHSISERNLSQSESEESEPEVEFEDEIDFLRSLDPKECKDQDHYRVLGLAKLRGRATDEQIRKAYRFKVLRHHPDKRRGAGEDIRDDDDYFTCITKAFEQLGTPQKRRAYDSVDPTFDDDVPDALKASLENKDEEFFRVFAPIFEKNSIWSTKKPVARLGTIESSREEVDKFYKFWYDFDSWREYSYLDEEEKEKGSDREERRWIDKNNKLQRNERKKDEMKRVRKLVDNAYNSDPRIAKFKESDKAEKLARKKAKQDAAQARRDEEERIRREAEEKERREKEEQESMQKEKLEAQKREKDAAKKAIKKERKQLRGICKDAEFFADDEAGRAHHMAEVDKLCEILSLIELEDLNKNLAEVAGGAQKSKFLSVLHGLNERLEREKMELMEKSMRGGAGGDNSGTGGKGDWSHDELALLIKAVNLFPAGTNQRWEVVASFINQHTKTPEVVRNAKETLSKAKELQHSDFHASSMKDEANKRAFENLEKQKKRDVKVDDAEASVRTESAAEVQGLNLAPWTADEQKLLEQALKTYPASLGTERWDKIADCLPNRSKKDCMRRYKELAELIRAKKAAMAQAGAANPAGAKKH